MWIPPILGNFLCRCDKHSSKDGVFIVFFRYHNDDGHGRIHESRGRQRSREDRDLRRYLTLRWRSKQIPVVPVHLAPTVYLRLRLFVLRAIFHHSRARRVLVHHTGVAALQSYRLPEVSLRRFFLSQLRLWNKFSRTRAIFTITIFIDAKSSCPT